MVPHRGEGFRVFSLRGEESLSFSGIAPGMARGTASGESFRGISLPERKTLSSSDIGYRIDTRYRVREGD